MIIFGYKVYNLIKIMKKMIVIIYNHMKNDYNLNNNINKIIKYLLIIGIKQIHFLKFKYKNIIILVINVIYKY